MPTIGVDPDGNFAIIPTIFLAAKIFGYTKAVVGLEQALEKQNYKAAGMMIGSFVLGGVISGGADEAIKHAFGEGVKGLFPEITRAVFKGLGSGTLSATMGGDFRAGFLNNVGTSLVTSGLQGVQDIIDSRDPKGWGGAGVHDLGWIPIEAAREGRWRDFIPGWGNGEYYTNTVIAGIFDSHRRFMEHPATQGAIFVGTSLIGGGILNSYKVFNTARLSSPLIRKGGQSLVQANRTAGNLFRDELAGALRAEGRTVNTEVFKRTPFGKRYIDIDVWHKGVNLGGIETKVGSSRYLPLQRLKDAWLGANGYPVQLVRKAINW